MERITEEITAKIQFMFKTMSNTFALVSYLPCLTRFKKDVKHVGYFI